MPGGAPDRTRTCNRRLRRPMLYPIELRAQDADCRGRRMVGVEGFEPPTSSSQSWRSTRLSYTPKERVLPDSPCGAPKSRRMVSPAPASVNCAPCPAASRIRPCPRHPRVAKRGRKSKKGAEAPFLGIGAPGEIRTPDHQVRSLVLYPTELRAQARSGIMKCNEACVNTFA